MKKIKKIVSCLLLTGVCFLCSCHRSDTFYISSCPIEEIQEMKAVKLVIEQCVFKKEDDVNAVFYPNAHLTQTKQQAVKIVENPKSWQPFMDFNDVRIINMQKDFDAEPLENFDCIFAVNKKFTFIDKEGNKKWICFVNARFFKE
jgi:hypothetical protein